MANETSLTIVGNLTADPELMFSPNGVAYVRFTVASTPRTFDRDSGEFRDGEALFMPCTAWREVAEHLAESLTKGTRVIVTGRLTQSTWKTDDGEKRTALALQVDEIGPSLRFAEATVRKTARRAAA